MPPPCITCHRSVDDDGKPLRIVSYGRCERCRKRQERDPDSAKARSKQHKTFSSVINGLMSLGASKDLIRTVYVEMRPIIPDVMDMMPDITTDKHLVEWQQVFAEVETVHEIPARRETFLLTAETICEYIDHYAAIKYQRINLEINTVKTYLESRHEQPETVDLITSMSRNFELVLDWLHENRSMLVTAFRGDDWWTAFMNCQP